MYIDSSHWCCMMRLGLPVGTTPDLAPGAFPRFFPYKKCWKISSSTTSSWKRSGGWACQWHLGTFALQIKSHRND